MILQERQWPSIGPRRSGFISTRDFGDLAMDLVLDKAKPREALRSLITFCPAGHYARSPYKQDVFASRPKHWPVKSGLITRANWPGPRGQPGPAASLTFFSRAANSGRADGSESSQLFSLEVEIKSKASKNVI